jgi:SAM-dependent methyltransferase
MGERHVGVRRRPGWHRRLVEDPRIYDAVQLLAGYRATAERLRRVLADVGDGIVLDLGAGTGNLAQLLPPGATYWGLDNDPAKLERLVRKVPGALALERSVLDTGLEDASADVAVCVDVAHHIDEDGLPRFVAEMARITRRRLVFVDPLWTRRISVGALLWRYDQGANPRRLDALLDAIRAGFEIERIERYRFLHHYVLCVARPLRSGVTPRSAAPR